MMHVDLKDFALVVFAVLYALVASQMWTHMASEDMRWVIRETGAGRLNSWRAMALTMCIFLCIGFWPVALAFGFLVNLMRKGEEDDS